MREIKKYKELLMIDKYNLDEMVMKQSHYFYEVSAEYCKALNEKDNLKEHLAMVDAKIGLKIRMVIEAENKKITVDNLNQKIIITKEHKQVYQEYLDAIKDVKMWEALKDSFAQRASMLKYMCELYISNYYSDTSVKTKGSRKHYEGGEQDK